MRMTTQMKTSRSENQLVQWRHDFHQHPELGFEETRTAQKVSELLQSFGVTVVQGLGGTGVLGVLKKGTSSRSLGIRADMDALPIAELNSFSYASKSAGKMHACGHDGHTTMLLGAAQYLAESGDFNGTAYFIFQPNEEHGLGAQAMIKDGLFADYAIDEVFAMHNLPGMPVGSFATCAGPIMASESLFEIDIQATGCHAALPHMGVDAITVGAQLVNALQTIVSRKLNPSLNGVVSVTDFRTDGMRNVLPGNAVLSGDCRALTPDVNRAIESYMRQIVKGICITHNVAAEVSYNTVFEPTINALEQTQVATEVAQSLFGPSRVNAKAEAKLFSEDFAHMSAAKPGCYIFMGNGVSGSHGQGLHAADYDFNDQLLVTGSSYWVELVEQRLV